MQVTKKNPEALSMSELYGQFCIEKGRRFLDDEFFSKNKKGLQLIKMFHLASTLFYLYTSFWLDR